MTEADWRTTNDVGAMLRSLGRRRTGYGFDPERFRDFARACARRTWGRLTGRLAELAGRLEPREPADQAVRRAFQSELGALRSRLAAAHGDIVARGGDPATLTGLLAEEAAAFAAEAVILPRPSTAAADAADRAARSNGWAELAGMLPATVARESAATWAMGYKVSAPEQAAQAGLIRCIFGNPFRPVAFDPTWRTEAVVGLARGMDEANDFAALPVLADALEDAGCADAGLLAHCRGPGPHARGCHAVDHVLGRW